MNNTSPDKSKNTSIPDLEIIDLDERESINTNDNKSDTDVKESLLTPNKNTSKTSNAPETFLEKYILKINWHIILLLVFILCIILLVYRFNTWGTRVQSDYDPDNVNTEFEIETYDNILPLLIKDELVPEDDGVRTVVALGNSAFADDKNSAGNLSELIEDLSDAVVYNCAVANTYLAASEDTFKASEDPMDAFNLYWLTTLFTLDNTSIYTGAFEALGDNTPEDAREAYETLTSLDFNTVDVIAIMYDGSDYLDGRLIYNPDNLTDIQSYYGNLSASIELIQKIYPHIRIIVMSPTYAYAINENGEYVSSDLYLYSEHPLSRYSMMLEQSAAYYGVSFLDNFYGTVNELNATDYLKDHLHLNKNGRQKLAERFVYALEYYDE